MKVSSYNKCMKFEIYEQIYVSIQQIHLFFGAYEY